jgi:hypothetical protein
MPGDPFQYAVIRVVPRVEREEFLNVGVIMFCRTRRFLDLKTDYRPEDLRVLAPAMPSDGITEYLDAMARVARGDAEAGPLGELSQSERFGWLTAPSSTVVQTSPVHSGVSDDPRRTLEKLFGDLVQRSQP